MQYGFVVLHDDGEFWCQYKGLVDNTRGLELTGGRWTLNGGVLPPLGGRMKITLQSHDYTDYDTVHTKTLAVWEATLEKYTLDERTGCSLRFINQKRV